LNGGPVFRFAWRTSRSHRVPALGRLTFGRTCALFATLALVILLSLGQQPAYLTEALPGWLLTAWAFGLTLPTIALLKTCPWAATATCHRTAAAYAAPW